MTAKGYLTIAIASLGAAALLGAGAWGLFGPGSPAAAIGYGMMGYACDPFEESVAVTRAADTDWDMMGGLGMMGETADEPGDASGPIDAASVAQANEWWMPCAEAGNGPVTSLDAAVSVARGYVASSGNPNLALGEVMAFSDNYYATAVEKDTGIGAFEFLIDPSTGAIAPEPGPNRMWNTKYGPMSQSSYGGHGNMMGGPVTRAPTTATMPIGVEQARGDAAEYLSEAMPGTAVSTETDQFYGYYTFHVLQGQDGPILGMLSVNGWTGAVWYHNWHGPFVAMEDTTANQ